MRSQLLVGALLALFAAFVACSSDDAAAPATPGTLPSTPTVTAEPTSDVPATSTPNVARTPAPQPTPEPGPELIRPLDEEIEVESAEVGLVVIQPATGARWSSLGGEGTPRPIRFEGDELLVRVDNEIVRLETNGRPIESVAAISSRPVGGPEAPGFRFSDLLHSPDQRYRIEFEQPRPTQQTLR